MSKRDNNGLRKDDTPVSAKRSRKATGFRIARPPVADNASRSAGSASSMSTSSRITTLVLGSNGRLGGRRKDKNHLTSKFPFMAFNPSPHSIFYSSSSQSSSSQSGGWLSSGEFGGWNPIYKFFPKLFWAAGPPSCPHWRPNWAETQKTEKKWYSGMRLAILLVSTLTYLILKSKLQEWLLLRDTTLDEILRHDGLGDFLGHPLCAACNIEPGIYKCKDCSGGGRLRCKTCAIMMHQYTPLHRIEVSLLVTNRLSWLALIQLLIVAMDRPLFRQRFPQKSRSPCTTRTRGMRLSVSFPWPSRIHDFRYLRHPSRECGLLWLPERQPTRSKNTTPKGILVSCDIHETKYCLYIWPSRHISWKFLARKRKYLRLLSPTITENRQRECFWYDCKFFFFFRGIYLKQPPSIDTRSSIEYSEFGEICCRSNAVDVDMIQRELERHPLVAWQSNVRRVHTQGETFRIIGGRLAILCMQQLIIYFGSIILKIFNQVSLYFVYFCRRELQVEEQGSRFRGCWTDARLGPFRGGDSISGFHLKLCRSAWGEFSLFSDSEVRTWNSPSRSILVSPSTTPLSGLRRDVHPATLSLA